MAKPATEGQAPSPKWVAVWFVLGSLATERAPWWVARWLADGHDGQALRELVGLNGKDPHAVRDYLPAALTETGAVLPTTHVAAAEAFYDLTEMLVSRRTDAQRVAQRVEQVIVQTGYDDGVLDLPLGHLYGLADEWEGGWGHTAAQLSAEVEARCMKQLHAAAS